MTNVTVVDAGMEAEKFPKGSAQELTSLVCMFTNLSRAVTDTAAGRTLRYDQYESRGGHPPHPEPLQQAPQYNPEEQQRLEQAQKAQQVTICNICCY